MQQLLHRKIDIYSLLKWEAMISSERTERLLRRTCAWIILLFLILGELGLSWDIQWHALVGRDRFWTPPHILIYLAVGGAGIISLFMVLVDTLRYRHRAPGVNEKSTVRILRIFHAPSGFVICGLGPLICLIAAPFDNYWHQLYGIDINLWSPFHLMGALGGLLTGVGLVYVFASEAIIDRQARRHPRTVFGLNGLEWGACILLSALLRLTLSALTQFPGFAVGPFEILTYPLPLVLGAGICLVSVLGFTRKFGTATLIGLLTVMHTLLTEAFVPWAVRLMVDQMGLTYRFPGRLPFFNLTATLLAFTFVATGFLVDSIIYTRYLSHPGKSEVGNFTWSARFGAKLGILAVFPIAVVAPLIIVTTTNLLPEGIVYMPVQTLLPLIMTLPLMLVVGVYAGMLGEMLGHMWFENRR